MTVKGTGGDAGGKRVLYCTVLYCTVSPSNGNDGVQLFLSDRPPTTTPTFFHLPVVLTRSEHLKKKEEM